MKTKRTGELIQDILDLEKYLSGKYGLVVVLNYKTYIYQLGDIFDACTKAYSIRYKVRIDNVDLLDSSRNADIIFYRHLFAYIAVEAGYTHEAAGEHIGKNHATITNSLKVIKRRLSKDSKVVKEELEAITKMIGR